MNIGKFAIERERERQINIEGYSRMHDDGYIEHELFLAAECYLVTGELGRQIIGKEVPSEVIPPPSRWPWQAKFWKPGLTPRRNYEKAGALYMAEVDRLRRAAAVSFEHSEHYRGCMSRIELCAYKVNEEVGPFIRSFNQQQGLAYANSVDKGFHTYDMGNGTRLALIHAEVSEALEAIRHGNPPSDHIPLFNGAEEELADVIIRCMDMAEKNQWRLAEAIEAKMQFNSTRPHMHGGKAF